MPSHTTHNTPALRFPGYTGVWEQRRFNELASVRRGLTYKPSDVYKSGVRVLRSSNISEDSFNISPDDIFVHNSAINIPFIKNGDILVTAANGSSRLVGKHAIVHNVPENSAVPGGFMLCLSSSEPNFLNASMSTSWYSKFIHTFVAGGNGSIGNISKSSLDTQFILVPSLDEQKKIGSFFSKLDSIIGLHQRQTKKLTELKQGLLQNMFPQEGESVPRLRFPGFTTHWKQQKIGSLITEYKEKVDRTSTLPVLTSSKTEGIVFQEDHFGSAQNHDVTGYNVLPRNYCTYRSRSDGTDFTFNVNNCCDKGIISKYYPVFNGKNNDTFFLSLMLNNNKEIIHEIGYTCVGTGQKVLSFSDLKKMSMSVPSLEEQTKLSIFFRRLDDLLTLHEQYVTTLIHLKKGLLQKMFPQD